MKLKDININQSSKRFLCVISMLGAMCCPVFAKNPTATENKKVNLEKELYNNEKASELLSDILFNQYNKLKDLPDAEFKKEIVNLIKEVNDAYVSYGCFALALENKNHNIANKAGLSDEKMQQIVERKTSAPVDELIKVVNVEMPHKNHMFTDSAALVNYGAKEGVIARSDERYPVNTYIKFNVNGKRDVCAESISVADAYINDFITLVSAYYDYKGQDANKIKNSLIKNFSKIMTLASKDSFTNADKQTFDAAQNEIYSVLPSEMFGDSQMCKGIVTNIALPYATTRLFTKLKKLGRDIDECIADGLAKNAKHAKKDAENKKQIVYSNEIDPNEITIGDFVFVDGSVNLNPDPDFKPFDGFSIDVKSKIPVDSTKYYANGGIGFKQQLENGNVKSNTLFVNVAGGRNWANGSHTEVQLEPGLQFSSGKNSFNLGVNIAHYGRKLNDNISLYCASYNNYNFNEKQFNLGIGGGIVFDTKYGRFGAGIGITYLNKTIIKKYGEIVNTPSLVPGTDRPELGPGEKVPN